MNIIQYLSHTNMYNVSESRCKQSSHISCPKKVRKIQMYVKHACSTLKYDRLVRFHLAFKCLLERPTY